MFHPIIMIIRQHIQITQNPIFCDAKNKTYMDWNIFSWACNNVQLKVG
jgi:hypothetical protein